MSHLDFKYGETEWLCYYNCIFTLLFQLMYFILSKQF